MDKKLDSSDSFNISADLKLSTIKFPKFPKNVAVTEEINNYLRDQLEQMKHENQSFQLEVSQKESEIKNFQSRINELTEKLGDYEICPKNEFTTATQIANGKIVELSKRLREKNSEIEVYKTKLTKLEKQFVELKKQSECETTKNDEVCVENPDELKKLHDKITSVTNKWIEEKNLNLQLKNDLKKANKWLQQEVGEKFETLLTLNNNTNWRGRAQIIHDLQQKNQELKEKFKALQESGIVLEATPVKKYDKKIETLSEENLQIKNDCAELKRKFEVMKARYKVQETELNLAKAKLSNFSEINESNKHTITKLTAQLSHFNDLKGGDLKRKEQTIKNLQQENESLQIELAKEKCMSEKKAKELKEKSDDIEVLNKRIRSARPPSSYVHRHENVDTKTIGRLEVERLRLLELTEVQNARVQEERNAHLKTQHLLRAEKQKVAKLEANLALVHLEQNSARSGYSTKSTSKPIDSDVKDKLELAEENIKALSTRLELEALERKRDLQEFSNILQNYKCDFKK